MLWRALKHVKDGFYIDVGAADPVNLSVTHLFSSRGWSGVNLEPDPEHFEKLLAARPRDTNLPVCAGSSQGKLAFFQNPETGLYTTREDVARKHEQRSFHTNQLRVASRTLADICTEHAAGCDIHFLRIKVEGAETDVLRGADFQRFRPWIILVEAIVQTTEVSNYVGWEALLADARYRFAWFDGVNRFYVAEEHAAELLPHFTVQPNIFDGFTRAADLIEPLESAETGRSEAERLLKAATEKLTAAKAETRRLASRVEALQSKFLEAARLEQEAELRAKMLDLRVRELEEEAATVGIKINELTRLRDAAEQDAAAVRASTSWRVTRPIRGIVHFAKGYLSPRQIVTIAMERSPQDTRNLAVAQPMPVPPQAPADIQRIVDIQQAILAELATQRQQDQQSLNEIRHLASEMERVLLTLAMEARAAKDDTPQRRQ